MYNNYYQAHNSDTESAWPGNINQIQPQLKSTSL